MRLSTLLLLLGSVGLPSALADRTPDSQLAVAWTQSGVCAYYFKAPLKKSPISETCIKYCEPQDTGYSECEISVWKDVTDWSKIDQSIIQTDDVGDPFVATPCICEDPAVQETLEQIAEVVAEGLQKLGKIICAIALETFKFIVDVGLLFVPGGAQTEETIKMVQAAKTFYENGESATAFFDNWVGSVCGLPDWNFDLWNILISAPPDWGQSQGCMRKNKKKCKKPPEQPGTVKPNDPRPTAPPRKTDPPPPKTTPPKSDPPKTTPPKSDPPKTTPPKSKTTPPSSTNRPSSTACKSANGAKSGANCEPTTPCKIQNPDKGFEELTSKLRFKRDNRLSLRRAILESRTEKKGKPCEHVKGYEKFVLAADNYPSIGELKADVLTWGYVDQDTICDYKWQPGIVVKKQKGAPFDSEHVMEWQVVTDFFGKLDEKNGKKYVHPDPRKNKEKVDFCTYWVESWNFADSQTFSIGTDPKAPKLTPFRHLASVYPSYKNYRDEMLALQRTINQQAKAFLFRDDIPLVWKETDMDGKVKKRGGNGRDKVIERLRQELGVRKYMTDARVKKIYKDQKERMGSIIEKLDTAMESHARINGTVHYTPWKKQGLLKEWNTHSDTKWDDAVKKHNKVMNKWSNDLDDKWCQNPAKQNPADKQFCERLRKLQKEMKDTPQFTKPW